MNSKSMNRKSLRPVGAYRIQFHAGFSLLDARSICDYLAELGISVLYASPIFAAKSGSQHGYDVTDPRQINPELGSLVALKDLRNELQERHIGWLQDIVPNHMAFSCQNPYLLDVFEHGQLSPYQNLFDINWTHKRSDLFGKTLIPTLGDMLRKGIAKGEIKLSYNNGSLLVWYWESYFPIHLGSWPLFLGRGQSDSLTSICDLMKEDPLFPEFLDLIMTLENWPPRGELGPTVNIKSLAERRKMQISELYAKSQAFKGLVERALEFYNSGEQVSQVALRDLLNVQNYKLTYWRFANGTLNYRRFFNINDLIALRMHDPIVFQFVHEFIIDLVHDGTFDGLRIDHIDGLRDPLEYLRRLRSAMPKEQDLWVPIYVEKILAGEELIDSFPADGTFDGTSGYEFLTAVNRLMVCNIPSFEKIYREFVGEKRDLSDIAIDLQYKLTDRDFPSETGLLTDHLFAAAQADRLWDELTWDLLRLALRELAAALKVYRTYVGKFVNNESGGESFENAKELINDALQEALRRSPQLALELEFLVTILIEPQKLSPEALTHRSEVVLGLQQYCGPLFAKGVEDWLFYAFHPLVQLGEVGGEPLPEPYPPSMFDHDMIERATHWPRSLNTLSTHDTKRAADVRARLNALSEMPDEWSRLLHHWASINAKFKKPHPVKEYLVPDANGEYFIYQTLLGSYPISSEHSPNWNQRLAAYFVKAIREAKMHTNWISPDSEYETLYCEFVESILQSNEFLESFIPMVQKLAHLGILNSLSQVTLQLTAPGIPEIYQGTELLDLSLVDPDNRRPVDYEIRKKVLCEISAACAQDCLLELISDYKQSPLDGRLKMVLIKQILHARANYQALTDGNYEPINVTGRFQNNLIAYSRNLGSESALVLVPRFYSQLVQEGQFACGTNIWCDTALALPERLQDSTWHNVITEKESVKTKQGKILVGKALSSLPVAVLVQV